MANDSVETASQPFQYSYEPFDILPGDIVRDIKRILPQLNITGENRETPVRDLLLEQLNTIHTRNYAVDLSQAYHAHSQEEADSEHAIVIHRLQPFLDALGKGGVDVDTGSALVSDRKTRFEARHVTQSFEAKFGELDDPHGRKSYEAAAKADRSRSEQALREERMEAEHRLVQASRNKDVRLDDHVKNYSWAREEHLFTVQQLVKHGETPAAMKLEEERNQTRSPVELQSIFVASERKFNRNTLPGGQISLAQDDAVITQASVASLYESKTGQPIIKSEGRPQDVMLRRLGVEIPEAAEITPTISPEATQVVKPTTPRVSTTVN